MDIYDEQSYLTKIDRKLISYNMCKQSLHKKDKLNAGVIENSTTNVEGFSKGYNHMESYLKNNRMLKLKETEAKKRLFSY